MSIVEQVESSKVDTEGNRVDITDAITVESSNSAEILTVHDEEVITVYRATKPGQGMFVTAKIGAVDMTLLVDTGASCTIVAEDVFRELKRLSEVGKVFKERRRLQAADGAPLKVLGKLKLPIQLGSVVVQQDVIGANITDSGILGYDFLKQHKCSINIANQELVIMGEKIASIKEDSVPSDIVYKVSLKDAHILPAMTECVLPAVLRRLSGTKMSSPAVVIEPKLSFVEKYDIVMATSMDNSNKEQVNIRVMNPSMKDIWHFKGTMVGQAEHLKDEVGQIGKEDEEQEEDQCIGIRLIGMTLKQPNRPSGCSRSIGKKEEPPDKTVLKDRKQSLTGKVGMEENSSEKSMTLVSNERYGFCRGFGDQSYWGGCKNRYHIGKGHTE